MSEKKELIRCGGLLWTGQEGVGTHTAITDSIGWPKLPTATDQYVPPLLSLPGLM